MSAKKRKVNYKKYFLHYFYCLAIMLLLTLTGFNINNYLNKQKILGASIDTSPLQDELIYWENLVQKNPSFIDGYLQLAKVYTEMGNKDEAINQIKIALTLDPNSSKIIEVEHQLGI